MFDCDIRHFFASCAERYFKRCVMSSAGFGASSAPWVQWTQTTHGIHPISAEGQALLMRVGVEGGSDPDILAKSENGHPVGSDPMLVWFPTIRCGQVGPYFRRGRGEYDPGQYLMIVPTPFQCWQHALCAQMFSILFGCLPKLDRNFDLDWPVSVFDMASLGCH